MAKSIIVHEGKNYFKKHNCWHELEAPGKVCPIVIDARLIDALETKLFLERHHVDTTGLHPEPPVHLNEPFRYSDPILNDRGNTHGNSKNQFTTAQSLKACVKHGPKWEDLTPQMREAIEMICTKLSRLVHGDPFHLDHWDDLSGYPKLVAETMRYEQAQNNSGEQLASRGANEVAQVGASFPAPTKAPGLQRASEQPPRGNLPNPPVHPTQWSDSRPSDDSR